MTRQTLHYAIALTVLLCVTVTALGAEQNAEQGLTLEAQCAGPFGDNAVLQQGIPLPVWGTSLPGARVTVAFDTQTKTTTADKNGAWRVVLAPLTAISMKSVHETPKGKRMSIVTELGDKKATKTIANLVVGEVWIGAGQSNMAGSLRTNRTRHHPSDTLEKARYPGLRHLISPGGQWVVCTPETAVQFKKVCFFFARRLQRDALVPVGMISAAAGGSRIETWLNQKPYECGGNYTNRIAPLAGYGIRGVLWYQGESNAKEGLQYLPKLKSLILGWRKAWGQGDFPVYFVQLPGYGAPEDPNPAGGGGWPEIRQAQFEALAVKNTAMAITIDIGDRSVHPPNKYDTGVRLARLALNREYGFKDLAASGPLYRSHKIEGDAIRIQFDYAKSGLMLAEKEGFLPPKPTPDKSLNCLAIQAKDGTWHWAQGKIEGSQLVVSSKDVKDPIAVRYAYVRRPMGCLLYNKDGLPAAPFTTTTSDAKR